jgi:hypothetical protein
MSGSSQFLHHPITQSLDGFLPGADKTAFFFYQNAVLSCRSTRFHA